MNPFITVISFNHPNELIVLKSRLEHEEIEFRTLDEETVQIDPFISNAIGGVKLQVKEGDIRKTKDILEELGYRMDTTDEGPINWIKINERTSHIPILNKMRVELRLLFILFTITSVIVLSIYLAIKS